MTEATFKKLLDEAMSFYTASPSLGPEPESFIVFLTAFFEMKFADELTASPPLTAESAPAPSSSGSETAPIEPFVFEQGNEPPDHAALPSDFDLRLDEAT